MATISNINSSKDPLETTITVRQLMEILANYDGRFPVCFKDSKNNMIPLGSIKLDTVNVLLSNHVYIHGVNAVVIDGLINNKTRRGM